MSPFNDLILNIAISNLYPDFLLIRYGEVTDEETTALKELVTYISQGKRVCHTVQGHMWEAPRSIRRQKSKGKAQATALLGFPWER